MAASFGRTEPRYETVPLGHHFPRHVFACAGQSRTLPRLSCACDGIATPPTAPAQLLTRQVGRAWAADDITDDELRGGVGFWPPATLRGDEPPERRIASPLLPSRDDGFVTSRS